MRENIPRARWENIIRTTLRNRRRVPEAEWDFVVTSCGEKVGDMKHAEQVIMVAEAARRLPDGGAA